MKGFNTNVRMFTGLPEVQMRHKNRSKESKGDFVEAANKNKGTFTYYL